MFPKKLPLPLIILLFPFILFSQTFYHTGSEEYVDSVPLFGILLAGGATDNNDGMRWLVERANGGDVVVLRASGSDGYNNYIYSSLGVSVNSVTSIVITSQEQANNPDVCEAVANAELIFIAGGNQYNYYSHWKGTCLQDAIHYHVHDKAAPIGGTSAGLAVLGEVVFTAQNGSIWTEEALNNPFHWRMALSNDFLEIPFMENVVTDSHYNNVYGDDNTRYGRHTVFMARMTGEWEMIPRGIGVNEYTAAGVDENGIVRVFGHPSYPDYVYFHLGNSLPEVMEEDTPLTWNNDGNALSVYRVKGNFEGSNTFDLNDWQTGTGGEWFRWYVEEGELHMEEAGYWDVHFEITSSQTGEPLEGAEIYLGGLIYRYTNNEGEALFANAIPESDLTYTVVLEGYEPLSGTINISEDGLEVPLEMGILVSAPGLTADALSLEFGPNPVRDRLLVKSSADNPLLSWALYDLSGKQLSGAQTGNTLSFNISLAGFAPGIYIMQIKTQNGIVPLKIVRE